MTNSNSRTLSAKPLNGRIALVTGASRGIGRSAALALAEAGAHVLALARTQGGLEELDDEIKAVDGTCSLITADLEDLDGIDRLGGVVAERWGKLDILVGNAAMLGSISPVPHIDPKLFERVMKINVTANWRLIRSFDPLLRASSAGRVIFVTSSVANSRNAYWSLYAASKSALDTIAECYAKEIAQSSIRVNLISPGPVATAMRAKAMPGEDPATLPSPAEIAPLFVELALPTNQLHMETINWAEWAKKS
ncbi:MAG: SDR family NAD(P)-dependent oxidoreductase [Robiginitomaculum sp.]|nr:SDR family NAD(P)-dependent oxidoreductase [Robiginitomaculum sp.]